MALAAILLGAGGGLVILHVYDPASGPAGGGEGVRVVAAENFWGSLASQLGGSRVQVYTIVSDPNADPHSYEANATDAIAVANAQLVIENGAGYDEWCQKLVAAAGSPGPVVLNVADLLGKQSGDNPHFWYGASYVNQTVRAVYSDLVRADPGGTSYYQDQSSALNLSLSSDVFGPEAEIRAKYAGVPVASTESIFAYMANSTGLDLLSPVEFMNAVAEGTDPPASSVTAFQDQLTNHQVRVMVYNAQTVTPLTTQMRSIAVQSNVAVVAVTETVVPGDAPFQVWMHGELLALLSALGG